MQDRAVCLDDTVSVGTGFMWMQTKKERHPSLTKNKMYEYQTSPFLEMMGLIKIKDNSKTFSLYSMKRFAFVSY